MVGIASKSELRMSFLRYALFTVPGVVLLGTLASGLSGGGGADPWFEALVKPPMTPPSWAFSLAWIISYVLVGLALAMVLHARGARKRKRALALLAVQLVLNLAWFPVFFAMHQMGPALSILAAMLVGVVALILVIWRIRPVAGLLLYPYFGWLMFLALLSYQLLALNPDAAALAPPGASTDIRL